MQDMPRSDVEDVRLPSAVLMCRDIRCKWVLLSYLGVRTQGNMCTVIVYTIYVKSGVDNSSFRLGFVSIVCTGCY